LFKQKRQAWLTEKQLLNLFCLIEEKPVDLQKMEQYFLELLAFVCVFLVWLLFWLWKLFFNMVVACAPVVVDLKVKKRYQISFILFSKTTLLKSKILLSPHIFQAIFPSFHRLTIEANGDLVLLKEQNVKELEH
jgi:hypothetical protein